MLEINQIYNMDCFTGIKTIPDKFFKLALCDIPYNIGIDKWDKIENYEEWVKKLFSELKRISEQQVIFFSSDYTKLFEEIETPYKRLIWHREGGVRGKNIKYAYEPFYWYAENPTYNRITEPNPYAAKDKRLKPERTISNVWSIPNLVGRKKESVGHPSQKPIKLIQRIVEMTTNENDLVFDGFSGSFTTAAACDNLKRNWICIEKELSYCKMGLKRVNENRTKLNLPYTCII